MQTLAVLGGLDGAVRSIVATAPGAPQLGIPSTKRRDKRWCEARLRAYARSTAVRRLQGLVTE
jgi:hypothetical protein